MSKTYLIKVDNCDGCPSIYYKAKEHIECGQPYCKKEKRNIEDEENIPDWCPLPDSKPYKWETPSEWQPIETAPNDGTRFLFTNGKDVVGTGYFIRGRYFAADSWQGTRHTVVTHWMPLPSPPQEQ